MGWLSAWGRGHLARLRGEMGTKTYNNDGDELDYYDEYPDEDPFSPKATCTNCNGLGIVTRDDREYNCTWCGGTGCQK